MFRLRESAKSSIILTCLQYWPPEWEKIGFLSMYMLVVLAIIKDPSLCPAAKFPDNPCMLVICPTKYLEHQMVSDHCLTQMAGIMESSH